jgi:hypothetical protein
MARISLVILAVLAVLWMAFSMIEESGTEMGFAPGTPDPNVCKTTLDFGWPLTWITWERSWNQAAGYDDVELGRFQLVNFVIHTLAILTPFFVVYWLSRFRSLAKRENASQGTLPG